MLKDIYDDAIEYICIYDLWGNYISNLFNK